MPVEFEPGRVVLDVWSGQSSEELLERLLAAAPRSLRMERLPSTGEQLELRVSWARRDPEGAVRAPRGGAVAIDTDTPNRY